MERQSHGFIFEENSIKEFDLIKSDNYTSPWDAFTKNGIPVSIKTKKLGCSIEMGDFFRQSRVEQDFILIVGFWEGNKNNIVERYILKIDADYWNSQFDNELVEQFTHIFDGITNDYSDDNKWKIRIKEANQLWDSTGSIIKVNFKRDHKRQKRVQCSIRKECFQELIDNYSYSF